MAARSAFRRSCSFWPAGLLLLLVVLTPAVSRPAQAAAVSAEVTVSASSTDAWAPHQTLTYSGTVTRPGRLAFVTMALPAGATVADLRSISGSVTAHAPPGLIIWRPDAPFEVQAGERLSIPVSGMNLGSARTHLLVFWAADSTRRPLSVGAGWLTLTDRTTRCPARYPAGQIAAENAKAGSVDWRVNRHDPKVLSVYSTRQSAACGEIAHLRVHATASPLLELSVYRMGYYGGAGARKVWGTEGAALGWVQPPVQIVEQDELGRNIHMVSAKAWANTIGVRLDGRFPPGTYLFKVDDQRGHQAYAPLTVRDDTGSRHQYLLQQAVTTWQAYNTFGGYSFYTQPQWSSQLTFDRPYDGRAQGSGQFLSLEYGLVYWMEKQGLDVAYWTDLDLHQRPGELAARTRTLILPAHDEYYSAEMRQALIDGIDAGVNLLSLGANQMYRKIVPDRTGRDTFVDYRTTIDDGPSRWRSRGYTFHEQAILGAEFGCGSFGSAVTDSGWLWTGIPAGTRLTGLAVGETDWVHPVDQAPIPPGQEILAVVTLDRCQSYPAQPLRMDIVARTAPSGARVLHAPTFGWSCFLVASCTWVRDLQIPPATAEAVGQAVRNMLSWVDHGLVPATATGPDGAEDLRAGRLRDFVRQRVALLQPAPGLPSVTLATREAP